MFPFRPPFLGYPFNNYYINHRKQSYSSYDTSYNRNNYIPSNLNFNKYPYSVVENSLSNKSISFECPPSTTLSSSNISKQVPKKDSSNEPFDNYFFEIFGLKLYFDDIMIICLLFFLYEEGVKDQELFISLILLLLT